ncbi:hypothetical protein FB45DRAFT_874077 [Roridomyces roridus]|uniref:Uncharacterized protein n=1 Tax=Roridomyces roridus TaxID=1738132 RepID=A0AAD7B9C8_9AGAR|nr:hypothetical protein FB45DRAFT_874077 [Roridomyces roridus]
MKEAIQSFWEHGISMCTQVAEFTSNEVHADVPGATKIPPVLVVEPGLGSSRVLVYGGCIGGQLQAFVCVPPCPPLSPHDCFSAREKGELAQKHVILNSMSSLEKLWFHAPLAGSLCHELLRNCTFRRLSYFTCFNPPDIRPIVQSFLERHTLVARISLVSASFDYPPPPTPLVSCVPLANLHAYMGPESMVDLFSYGIPEVFLTWTDYPNVVDVLQRLSILTNRGTALAFSSLCISKTMGYQI